MLHNARNIRTLLMLAAAATISLQANSQTYSQRYIRDANRFRPTNVRSDVDSDVYGRATTRGGFNAYQGRRGSRDPQSRFFDIRRDVVRPPTVSERYYAAKDRHQKRITYDYGTQKYPSDYYSEAQIAAYDIPEPTATGIPRLRTDNFGNARPMRMLTGVRRGPSNFVPDEYRSQVKQEREALDASLAQTNIVEFKSADGETVLTNEPEKYRNDPAYVEVENHSQAAEESNNDAR